MCNFNDHSRSLSRNTRSINVIQNKNIKQSRNVIPYSGSNHSSLIRNPRIGTQSLKKGKNELQNTLRNPEAKIGSGDKSEIPNAYKKIIQENQVNKSTPIHIQLKLSDLISQTEKIPVSYTHLTLPTILLVQISVVAVSLKKKKTK
eukprot:TRINITY_DN25586_c0_g1_i1.p1 TRINITY_DN25586_c0_g1~~TRINITY_DN25586_c0_g1_i1.p1  ORF type:complete len:146 (-),score=33.69 TRINITY_DN25586_c0_g1_i1:70-507(-)